MKFHPAHDGAHRRQSPVRHAQDQIAILEAKSVKGDDRTGVFIDLLNELTGSFNQIEMPGPATILAKHPAEESIRK
jgi:hypothetical protein